MLIQREATPKLRLSRSAAPRYNLSVLQPSEVGPEHIAAWADLEYRAAESNAFLSPHFVMPAIQYLESQGNILMLFVERECPGSKDLIGVAIFKVKKPTRKFPLPHLLAFETVHSYLSGFLVDRDYADKALELIYGFVTRSGQPWHGLRVNTCSSDLLFSPDGKMLAEDHGMNWTTFGVWERAVLAPIAKEQVFESLSKNQRKNYRKRIRQLEEVGRVDWYLISGEESLERCADEFIRLEHMGWKGEKGSSLYSNPNHTRFFKEVVEGFNREKRVYFTELALNDQTISSTSNLISGNVAFAFKIGWDPAYAKFSPGIINEVQLMERMDTLPDGVEFIDSSAEPDSYLNEWWPGRREIRKGIFTFTKLGQMAMNLISSVKNVKRMFLSGKKIASLSFLVTFESYLNELILFFAASQQWVLH